MDFDEILWVTHTRCVKKVSLFILNNSVKMQKSIDFNQRKLDAKRKYKPKNLSVPTSHKLLPRTAQLRRHLRGMGDAIQCRQPPLIWQLIHGEHLWEETKERIICWINWKPHRSHIPPDQSEQHCMGDTSRSAVYVPEFNRCPDKMPLDKMPRDIMPPDKMPPTVEYCCMHLANCLTRRKNDLNIIANLYSKYQTPTHYL